MHVLLNFYSSDTDKIDMCIKTRWTNQTKQYGIKGMKGNEWEVMLIGLMGHK